MTRRRQSSSLALAVALAGAVAVGGVAPSTGAPNSPAHRVVSPPVISPPVVSPPVISPLVPPRVAWRQIEPGARTATIIDIDREIPIFLVELDLEHFRAEVVVGDGWPPRAATAAELRATTQAVAAVNGGFFDVRRASLGLRIAAGKTRVPLRPRVDWGVLCLRDRRARIIHGRDFQPDPHIRGAIQVGPRLIVDGAPVKLKPQVARRTAVALDREGRVLTLAVVDRAIEAGALAARLAELGNIDAALLLDGGPSTQLSLHLGRAQAEDVDFQGLYPVPDLLAVYRR